MQVFLFGLFFLFAFQAQTNALIKRFQILEDRFQTSSRYLHPIEHDFFFNISAATSETLLDIFDEAKKASDKEKSKIEKEEEAKNLINKYINTEFFLRASVGIGGPLPSFHIRSIQFLPNIRFTFSAGALLAMVGEKINFKSLSPAVLEGDVAANYMNRESKLGLFTNYKIGERKRWSGMINLYRFSRADFLLQANAKKLVEESKVLTKRSDPLNTTTYLNLDHTTTYRRGNFQLSMGMEELPLSELSNNEEKAGKLLYDANPLLRAKMQYTYRTGVFQIVPFFGVHKRKDYDAKDGYYGGGHGSVLFFKDRIQWNTILQWDAEYTTLAQRIKLWPLEISYTLKTPRKEKINGIKLSKINGAQVTFIF